MALIDPASLTVLNTIALGATGEQLTAGRSASRAAVVLSGGRVAVIALDEARVARTVRVAGAVGAAIDGAGRTWVVAGRFVRLIPTGRKKVSKRPRISLPAGAGGAVTLSPRDARLAIGSRSGASSGAIVIWRRGAYGGSQAAKGRAPRPGVWMRHVCTWPTLRARQCRSSARPAVDAST